MLVLKTDSISEFNFFKNNKLIKSKLKDSGKLFAIFNGNSCVHFDITKNTAPMRLYINKTLKESYAYELLFEENLDSSNSEQNVVFIARCLNTNKTVYYIVSQMKQPFANLKRVANASGVMQGINEMLKDIVKGLR